MCETPQRLDSDLVAGLQAHAQRRESERRVALETIEHMRSQAEQKSHRVDDQLPWRRKFWGLVGNWLRGYPEPGQ